MKTGGEKTGGDAVEANRMPLIEHLIELRDRLMESAASLAVMMDVQ